MRTINAKLFGHFYETFGDDARIVSSICGLTLTKRRNSEEPTCGFPMWGDLDGICADLAKAGYSLEFSK